MRIYLTGATGFVGSNLATTLALLRREIEDAGGKVSPAAYEQVGA
jgi:nucleoside-diphosphate-sugar epimerase